MTAYDDIQRTFREFKRYTGDGFPSEPSGAALPIGDPQSGPYSPKKSELRATLGGLAQDLMDGISVVNGMIPALETARDGALSDIEGARSSVIDDVLAIADDWASLQAAVDAAIDAQAAAEEAAAGAGVTDGEKGDVVVSGGGLDWRLARSYDIVSDVEAANISAGISEISTRGYLAVGIGGGSYVRFVPEVEAQAVIEQINAVSDTPLTTQKEWAITHAMRRLKSGGLLAVGKLGALLDLGGAGQTDQDAAYVDWIRPTAITPSLAGSGTTVYTPGKGIQFSGASYVTLNATFDTIPGVTLDEAHVGVCIVGTGVQNYTQTNDNPVIGGGSRLGLRPNNEAGAVSVMLNTNTAVAVGTQVVGRSGHTIANRISSATVEAYRDGELMGQTASAVQSVPVSTVTIGWWSTPNEFSTDTVSFAHVGGKLTAADAALLYDIMMEYRHLILSGANAGGLIQSADGAWWELGGGFVRTPYHYGADEVDDTQAWRDMCALQHDVRVPAPRSSFKVIDGVPVLARVTGDNSRVYTKIATQYSRNFDMRDKSKLAGLLIDYEITATQTTDAFEAGQHCCVVLGRFHGTADPIRDVEIDVKINMLTNAPAAVYVIGNVKNPKISYDVSGKQINGAAFLAHWGVQIDPDGTTEHSIQRPRGGRIVRGVGKSLVTAGHRGFYFSGVSDWRVDHLEAHNFTACMGVAPGDKPAEWDDLAFNSTRQKLLAGLSFGTVILENPAGTACRMWGRTAFINGRRWYSTDLDSQASTMIENLQIRRGPATIQGGDEAVMLDIDIGANIDIEKLSITNAPGLSSTVTDVLEPAVRINGGRNIKIAGRIVGRVGTHVYAGCNIDLAIDAERQSVLAETSSASAGVKLLGEVPTATVVNAISAGATSITLLASPACHIVPGMEFEYSGTRFVFAASLAGDNLTDANVVVPIYPAPASIAASGSITVLGGPSHVTLRGSEFGFYRGHWYSSPDARIPHDINIVPNITYSWDDNVEIDGGCGYRFRDGVFDFGNRRNDVAARDVRINGIARDVLITGNRFSPSPGSRLTINHVLANAGCSGIICRDNYGYGVAGAGTKFSIPATGADGVANINSNYEAP